MLWCVSFRVLFYLLNNSIQEEEGLVVGALSREYYGDVVEGDEEWSDAVDLRSYGLDFTAFDPRLVFLMR